MSENEELVTGAELEDTGDLLLRLRSSDEARRAWKRAALRFAAGQLRTSHPLAAIELLLMAEDMRPNEDNRPDDTVVISVGTPSLGCPIPDAADGCPIPDAADGF